MIKGIITFSIIAISHQGVCQKDYYTFSIKFLSCCGKSIYHDPIWQLQDSSRNIFSSKENTVNLPKSGTYYFISEIYDNQPIPFIIREFNQEDTIKLKCFDIIGENSLRSKKESILIYGHCSTPIDSIYKEYFPDGRLKIHGNFENGIIKDSIVEYYHSGTPKSKTIKDKKKYLNYSFYPDGRIQKFYRYHLTRKKFYQLFEYDDNGKLTVDIDYSRKFSFRHYDTGTIKSSNPGRKFEQYFLVSDSIRYEYRKGVETTYFPSGKTKTKLKIKPLFWTDNFHSSKAKTLYQHQLKIFLDDSLNNLLQELTFSGYSERTIWSGEISKLELKDITTLKYYKNGKLSLKLYTNIYEGKEDNEVMFYNATIYTDKNIYYQDFKPQELEKYFEQNSLKIKSW